MVLTPQQIEEVRKILSPINKEVKILFFKSNQPSCIYCNVIEELLADINKANNKVTFEVYDVSSEVAQEFNVKHGPTMLFRDKPNIIYMGIPSNREFPAFLGDLLLLGTDKLEFEPDPHLLEHLKEINDPIDILVFVTPECPYCPYAVKAAHRIAYFNPNVKGIMIEAHEYPEMADSFNVMGVPKNVILNRDTGEVLFEWEGSPPMVEAAFDYFVHQLYHAVVGHEH